MAKKAGCSAAPAAAKDTSDRLRIALERIVAECGPDPQAREVCPCVACTLELHAWMIARDALRDEEKEHT